MSLAGQIKPLGKLRALDVDFAQIAALVETQLSEAIGALDRRDIAVAERVIAVDKKVDALNRQIDQKVIEVLKEGGLTDRQLRQIGRASCRERV